MTTAKRMKKQLQRTLDRSPRLKSLAKTGVEVAWQVKVGLQAATNAPVVIEDAYGVKTVIQSYERRASRWILTRPEDAAAFEFMKQFLRPGDVVLDVGANVGVYSAYAAGLVAPTGQVLAFEPVPATAARFAETLAVNRSSGVTLLQAAVGDHSGSATMHTYSDPGASGWSSLGLHKMHMPDLKQVGPDQTVDVPIVTLDESCAERGIDTVAFCKVDVEGFEKGVFTGATKLLTEARILSLCFEISEDPLVGEGGRPSDLFGILFNCGYRVYRDVDGTLQGPVDSEAEEARLTAGSRPYYGNYFAAPPFVRLVDGRLQRP